MPMYRRLPKRGFTNPFKVTYLAVNLRDLERVTGDEVSPESLLAAGIMRKASRAGQAARPRRRRPRAWW